MAVFGLWFLANYNNISAFVGSNACPEETLSVPEKRVVSTLEQEKISGNRWSSVFKWA